MVKRSVLALTKLKTLTKIQNLQITAESQTIQELEEV
jgi:hypothetical protein